MGVRGMGGRRLLPRMLIVAALGMATACGADDAPRATSPTVTSVSVPGVTPPPGVTTPDAPRTTAAQPPEAPGIPRNDAPDAKSTVVLRTVSVQGVAIPYVPVRLSRFVPCDPASHDLPEGTTEQVRWDGTTDANGQTGFLVPVGCYRFGMTPPPGTNPVPEGLHTLFVESEGQIVHGQLRFQDPAPDPVCAGQTIVHDLGEGPPYTTATPTVSECDGFWAVISWDIPGDSQRIVRRGYDSGWTTYVRFPHDICWSQATAEGVPANLEKYFQNC
ncbi:hypothetical protein [Nocardia sp. NPDC050406]|uniref:hypothetical protein n=1 Tax=Nocardia sp. NPDC050406 TaxID=3364318 RepID=UPI00379A401A